MNSTKQEQLEIAQNIFEYFSFPEGYDYAESEDWEKYSGNEYRLPVYIDCEETGETVKGDFSVTFTADGKLEQVSLWDGIGKIAGYSQEEINDWNEPVEQPGEIFQLI